MEGQQAAALSAAVRVLGAVDATVLVVDPQLRVAGVSAGFVERTGIPAEVVLGVEVSALLASGQEEAAAATRQLVDGDVDQARFTRRAALPGGRERTVFATVRRLRDEDGSTVGYVATVQDVGGLEADVVADAEIARRQRDILDRLPVPVAVDLDGVVSYANAQALELFGVASPSALGERLACCVPRPGSGPDGPVRWRVDRPDGTWRTVDRTSLPAAIGGRLEQLSTFVDVTELVAAEDRLRELAHRDPLTGLLNRRALTAVLEERCRNRVPTALLFVDLDGFKRVNDTWGHAAGDVVLREVADRLQAIAGSGDVVARLAGDELVVVTDPAGAEWSAAAVQAAFVPPMRLPAGEQLVVGASVGTAVVEDPARPTAAEDALRAADRAMYEAKRLRRAAA